VTERAARARATESEQERVRRLKEGSRVCRGNFGREGGWGRFGHGQGRGVLNIISPVVFKTAGYVMKIPGGFL